MRYFTAMLVLAAAICVGCAESNDGDVTPEVSAPNAIEVTPDTPSTDPVTPDTDPVDPGPDTSFVPEDEVEDADSI